LPRLTYCILWVGSGWDMVARFDLVWSCTGSVYDLTGASGDPILVCSTYTSRLWSSHGPDRPTRVEASVEVTT
jgi:hypothetical protein